MLKNLNFWFISSLLISLTVIIPILTVFSKKLENTVMIGIDTNKETKSDEKNQTLKFLNIFDFI